MKIFWRYHALLKTSGLREDTIERLHIKHRKGEKNDPFQDQYNHRLRLLLAPYYSTEQYRRITSRAFTGKYGGVTERFFSVNGRNCLVYLSNTAVNGPVTDGVLVDLGQNQILNELDYFGAISLFSDQPHTVSAFALGHVKCIEMEKERFNKLVRPILCVLKEHTEQYCRFLQCSI